MYQQLYAPERALHAVEKRRLPPLLPPSGFRSRPTQEAQRSASDPVDRSPDHRLAFLTLQRVQTHQNALRAIGEGLHRQALFASGHQVQPGKEPGKTRKCPCYCIADGFVRPVEGRKAATRFGGSHAYCPWTRLAPRALLIFWLETPAAYASETSLRFECFRLLDWPSTGDLKHCSRSHFSAKPCMPLTKVCTGRLSSSPAISFGPAQSLAIPTRDRTAAHEMAPQDLLSIEAATRS